MSNEDATSTGDDAGSEDDLAEQDAAVVGAAPADEPTDAASVAPEPTHATVEVTYRPGRARVSVDGDLIAGDSPLLIDELEPGSHRIVVEARGFRSFEEEIELSAGERKEVTARLRRIPRQPTAPPGRLSINTRPWSKVFVGSRLLGTTPIAGARVTSGAVRLRLVDRDGRTHTKTVRVPAGGSQRVFYDLGR